MHIANAMGTKVLGLHAASNPARSGPYSDLRYCVDRYDDAARKYLGKPASELSWGTKIEHDGVMDLVTVDDASPRSNGVGRPARRWVRAGTVTRARTTELRRGTPAAGYGAAPVL